MSFTLPALPFAEDALEPVYSARTISFHYGKHHKAYVDNLNKLIAGTDWETKSLEEIILSSSRRPGQDRHLQQFRPGLEPHFLLALHEASRRRQAHR